MKKAFYFDVETTGVDCKENAMTQIAAIIEYGDVKDSIVLDINPNTYNKPIKISDDALVVTNKTHDMLKSYPASEEQFTKFIAFLDKHINKFDKSDKLYPIGYNSTFDMGFLIEWFLDNNHKYFGSYFYYKDVDVYKLYNILMYELDMPFSQNTKLGTLCELFNVPLDNAHDALADIEATKKLYAILKRDFITFNKKV